MRFRSTSLTRNLRRTLEEKKGGWNGRLGISPSAFSSTRKCRDEQEEGASAALFPRLRRVSCSLFLSPFVSKQAMTNYHLTPPTTLPSLGVQEAKEKRRKVLEAAAKVRRENYQRFLEKTGAWRKYLRTVLRTKPSSSPILRRLIPAACSSCTR